MKKVIRYIWVVVKFIVLFFIFTIVGMVVCKYKELANVWIQFYMERSVEAVIVLVVCAALATALATKTDKKVRNKKRKIKEEEKAPE